MTMRNFLIITFLFFSWFSVAQVTPSVTIFTNYNYNNSPDSSVFADNYRGFQLERAYFGAKTNLSDNMSAGILFDVGANSGGSSYTVFLKKAYAKWQYNEDLSISMGLQSTKQFSLLEKHWGFRYVEKSAQDYYGLGSSADLGVTAVYSFKDNITFDASIMNGEGYKNIQDADGHFKTSMGVTFEPRGNFIIRGYCGREGFDRALWDTASSVLGANAVTKSIAIFYDNDKFSFGYERTTKKNHFNIKKNDLTVSSYYGSYSCDNNLTFFVRADDYDEGIEDVSQSLIDIFDYAVVGVEKTLAEGVKVAVNYKNMNFSQYDPVEEENFVCLNLEIKF